MLPIFRFSGGVEPLVGQYWMTDTKMRITKKLIKFIHQYVFATNSTVKRQNSKDLYDDMHM